MMKFSKEGLMAAIRAEDAAIEREAVSEVAREEVTRMNQPDHIDADTWSLIQDTGRLATERLYELISSPKFFRLRAGDQVKLIQLAQNRAFGLAAARKEARRARVIDVTAEQLRDTATRALLPEYKM